MSKARPSAFSLLPGRVGLLHAVLGQVRILPAGEEVLQVPVALAVADEHEKAVHAAFPPDGLAMPPPGCASAAALRDGRWVSRSGRARRPWNRGRACGRGAQSAALHRALREEARSSARCAQLDALAGAGEDDAVVADHRAAAQRREADRRPACGRRCGRRARAREWSFRAMPRPSAAASPSSSAVPEGASTFMRWCISRISMSKSSPSVAATLRDTGRRAG